MQDSVAAAVIRVDNIWRSYGSVLLSHIGTKDLH